MLLFRAINTNDYDNLINNKDIECSLIRTNDLNLRRSGKTYYNLCIKGKREYALDVAVGHVAGKRLNAGLSPWISTTKDFDFVCSEYAVPQAGAFNELDIRKPVIIIEKNNILSDVEEIKRLRKNIKKEDIIIDVSNGNLNKFYKKAFMSEAYNSNMPGYDKKKVERFKHNPDAFNIKGISNCSFYAKEVLFFKQIKRKDIKGIIYPMLQDILYGCNFDIENNSEFLINNIDKIYILLNNIENIFNKENKDFLKFIYPDYKNGNNLTDYLYNNYKNIDGNNIYIKYDNLKKHKREILKIIITVFNKMFNCNLELNRIIDDELLVLDLENPIRISDKQIYDLLIVQENNKLYKYNPSKKKYMCSQDTIDRNKIKNKQKQYNLNVKGV